MASGFSRKIEEPEIALDDNAKELRIGYPGSAARVFATPETRRTRRQGVLVLDTGTVAWLSEHMHPGDVLYDIGAGIGAYTITGAISRAGLVVAFEPGFAAFKRLCDNLLLNGCSRSVIPMPIALGDRTRLLELEYPHAPGEDNHVLRAREWRSRRDGVETRYTQPVPVERLDDVVSRHALPSPQVLRVNVAPGAVTVLEGAEHTLRSPDLRSVLVTAKDIAQAEEAAKALEPFGFSNALITDAPDWKTLTVHRAADRSGRAGGWRNAFRAFGR